MTPLFSIITAAFNSERTICDCIGSVQEQTFTRLEHIIVDGQSTDNTISLVERRQHERLKLISEPDSGIYDAINKGVRLSIGQYIGLLHSDDLFFEQSTLAKIAELVNDTAPDIVYGNLIYVDADDTKKIRRRWNSGQYSKTGFRWGWMPPHPAVFFKSEFLAKVGFYRTDLRISGDYELLVRAMYINTPSTVYLNENLVRMRVGGVSNSTFKGRLTANWEDRKAWEVNGLAPPFMLRFMKPLRKVKQFLPC